MILGIVLAVAAISSFSDVVTVEREFPIPAPIRVTGEKGWTYWSYCAISPGGDSAYFLQPASNTVAAVGLSSQTYGTYVESGRKRHETALPVALGCAADGDLLVSDVGNRRVLEFRGKGDLRSSFLLPTRMLPPTELYRVSDSLTLVAGVRLDSVPLLNSGQYGHLFNADGVLLRSFMPTPTAALERNLWIGVAAVMATERSGQIFAGFSTEGKIISLTSDGETRTTFDPPSWFVPTPPLPKPALEHESEPPRFWQSWTRLIKLVLVDEDRLLFVCEANHLIEGTDKPFVIAIYDTSGKIVNDGFSSDCWPVGCDKTGAIYFLSLTGDRILKTHLKE